MRSTRRAEGAVKEALVAEQFFAVGALVHTLGRGKYLGRSADALCEPRLVGMGRRWRNKSDNGNTMQEKIGKNALLALCASREMRYSFVDEL
jgi:hypothetical protein